MAYSVGKLIAKSYYLSGIVGRDIQSVSGSQLTDGKDLLNALLAIKTANQGLIPYFKEYQFNAVPGQEKYFIPGLINPETLVFFIDQVRYSTTYANRKKYFGNPRAENITSLPFNWHIERTKNGSNLFLYFLPDKNYPMTLWGKFGLDEFDIETFDLLTVYDAFYIEYLRYALAEYICADYAITFKPQAKVKLDEIEYQLLNIGNKDYSMIKLSTLQRDVGLNYGDVNLGKGWRP
ncbi:MAG TPA: hypothetical protein VMV86_07115 [Methanosarcinales archaeon]|nr:hypothetical protein [Methanosarcinales archaeon]